MIVKKHIVFLSLWLLAGTLNVIGQTNFSSQDELKKEADRLFYEKQYDKSLPLFSQLLSLYPKDPNYNYKFGASQLFAESDKEKPLRYLKFAASKPNVNPEAYYFLARAYHLNYEFDAAITYYNKFKTKADKKQLAKFPVDLLIRQCENGKNLLSNIKKINVLEKKEVKRSDFFRSYKLEGIDGKIIVKPDEFKSKYDIKVNETSIIYFPANAREVYYSSYGKDGSNGKDIYRVVKLPNNEWSKPQALSSVINSPYDEEFPFMHPDGKTLYFCSKGHNSMGGYDVFKSEYDPVSGEWSKPVNLDFAISSADDDILFISDIDNKFAYFASNRESGVGYVNVYKVTVEAPKDALYAMIKGKVIDEANPNKSFAKITIIDPHTNKTIGIQHTNDKGEYIIVLPKPDTEYKFLVETSENAPIHSATIKVPPVEKDMAVKQEIIFSGSGNAQKMVVKNIFDETVTLTPSDPLYVEHVIKRSAKLDVNTTEEEVNALSETTTATETQPAANTITKEEALTQTEEALNTLTETYQQAQKEAGAAFEYAQDKSRQAQKLLKEINDLKEQLSDETLSSSEQKTIRQQIAEKEFEAALAANEANTAYALALGLESDAQSKKQDVQQLEKLLNNIENTDDITEINQLYQSVAETVTADQEANLSSDIELQRLTEKYQTSEEKLHKQQQYVRELKNNQADLKQKITQLEQQRDNSKKKKEYEALDNQIAALKIDLDDIDFDLENAEKKLTALQNQYDIDKQAYLSGKTIVNHIKSTEPAHTITDDAKKQLAYRIGAFEQENLLAHYPVKPAIDNTSESNTETSVNEITYEDLKDQYDIIDENGEIINYSTTYSNQLAETDNISDPYQKKLQIAKINQDWINDIQQEINIKQQIAETTGDISKKLKLEDEIASLKELKRQKQQETEQLLAQAEQSHSSENTSPETAEETSGTENKFPQVVEVENVTVEDENGDIIDFVTPIEEELQAAETIEDEHERNLAKAKAYQKWVNATNEVIALRKLDMAQANESEKVFIESEINTLEQIAQEKYQLAEQYYNAAQESETLAQNNTPVDSRISGNEEADIPEEIRQTGIVDENGNVINYTETFQNQLDENQGNTAREIEIRQEWNQKIEADIAYQEWKLQNTDNLNDKINIKNKINTLEQQLELNNIEIENNEQLLAANSETPEENTITTETTETTETENNLAETTINTGNETILTETTRNTENKNTTVQPAEVETTGTLAIQNTINQKPLDEYTPTDEDAFSDIKYNNELTYQYPTAKTNLIKAKKLKNEAAALANESQILKAQMLQTQDENQRKNLLAQADEKQRESEEKQLQVATFYANANKDEYFNNRQILQNLSNQVQSNDATFAEVLTDEANYYFAEADKLRQQAANYPNFSSKANALQKAYEYELKALDKQRKAIEIFKNSAPQQTAEIIASTQTLTAPENAITENQITDNTSTASTRQSSNTDESTSETSEETGRSVSLPENFNQFAVTSPEAERLEKQADVLEQEALDLQSQADFLRDSANTVIKKKKIKAQVLAQADELAQQAVQKQSEAENLRRQAETEKQQLSELNAQLAQNHKELTNTQLSEAETQAIANLSPEEIQSITQKQEFSAFKDKKSTARRLVKEAEVEYMQAEEVKKEMESQNALIAAIQALASSSDEPGRKEKSEKQIAEMQRRINKNQEKLQQLQTSAQEKEQQALRLNKEADQILTTLPDNEVLAFTAIEKAEISAPETVAVPDETLAENINPAENNRLPEEVSTPVESENTQPTTNTENETTTETLPEETPVTTEPTNTATEETPVEETPVTQPTEETETYTQQVTPDNTENQTETPNDYTDNQPENNIETATTASQPVSVPASETSTTVSYESNPAIANQSITEIARQPIPVTRLNQSYFKLSNNTTQAAYSESNPIPRNPELPEGLIFKIQIGAFRNPIPQNHFKGFAPIMAEDAGNGITRYTAGLFTNINEAIFARDEIRPLGYPDAFVVAFYNGKRISIPEARKIMDQQGETLAETSTSPEISNNSSSENETSTTTPTETEITLSVDENAQSMDNDISVDVQHIKGVFYTVQVGVYSKPVTEGPLLTIKPLNSEQTANGYIRYTSGRFTDLDEARRHKQKVSALIPDAFITAYHNGKRIPVSEATRLLQQNNNNTSGENTSTSPVNSSSETPTTPKKPVDKLQLIEKADSLQIEFKVLLEKYTEEVPIADASKLLKLSGKGVKHFEYNDATYYTIGSYPDYQSALDKQIEMKSNGFENATVIAFKNQELISVEQALELIKE